MKVAISYAAGRLLAFVVVYDQNGQAKQFINMPYESVLPYIFDEKDRITEITVNGGNEKLITDIKSLVADTKIRVNEVEE